MRQASPLLIGELMERSGVAFGTSGARGLASDMTDAVCYAYTQGFLHYLRARDARPGSTVGIARDLRSSSKRIATACAKAVGDLGLQPVNCGEIPTPALAHFGITRAIPTLMVTGSHIPEDRNGIKFNTAEGEIRKADEQGIRQQTVVLPGGLFSTAGELLDRSYQLSPAAPAAHENYVQRYLDFFPRDCLRGRTIGLYEHSSVARGALRQVLSGLGARVERLGFSEAFVAVDTEAIRPEDVELGQAWGAHGRFDCLVSSDGDGDRPLVSDERGNWLRGDIAGVLCARYLGADAVVTPVSSNTALERSAWFPRVIRTRIGSPYVIEGMQQALRDGARRVVGYEANGGFLIASPIQAFGRELAPLPTRDALIVALGVLLEARREGQNISRVVDRLPHRYTASHRLQQFPSALSRKHLAALSSGDSERNKAAIEALLGRDFGPIATLDTTDGLRIGFVSGEVAHVRPSGNAPELRVYTEADSPGRAAQMTSICLRALESWRE